MLNEAIFDLPRRPLTDKTIGMKTSNHWGSLQVLKGLWLLVPGCGAFNGGQSGTDSLDVLGVVSPATKCDSAGCDGTSDSVPELEEPDSAEPAPSATPSDGALPSSDSSIGVESSPPAIDVPDSGDCLTDLAGPSLGDSTAVYVAKDEQATVCLRAAAPNKLCMVGSTVAAGEDYAYWGGGMGFVMSTSADGGVSPLDAPSLGIEGVRFKVDGLQASVVLRTYLNQVDSPEIIDPQNNYIQNSFQVSEMSENGVFEHLFINAWPPAWTNLDVDEDGTPDTDVPFDPTQLNSLQFFMVAQTFSGYDFEVCISDIQWINAAGEVVLPE